MDEDPLVVRDPAASATVGPPDGSPSADCLQLAGFSDAADITARQARLVGSMQHPMVVRDFPRAATALRDLAPTSNYAPRSNGSRHPTEHPPQIAVEPNAADVRCQW